VLFGGEPYGRLVRSLPDAATIALLPAAHALGPRLSGLAMGRRPVPTVLPVGLAGTARFLRDVGSGAGVASGVVEATIDRELEKVVPLLRLASRSLDAVPIALFLPTDLAAAVGAFAADLGAEVRFVALPDAEDASRARFLRAFRELAPTGTPDPDTILEGPSRNEEIRKVTETFGIGEPRRIRPVVIGSTVQSSALEPAGVPVIQLGFPSLRQHWIYPVPYMGFNGAVGLAQRLMDATK
jgi:nitrogenase molybdenum-iron protein alpha/beta subunit